MMGFQIIIRMIRRTGVSKKKRKIVMYSQVQLLARYLKQIFFYFISCHSLHAKPGETVLVYEASGGVGKYYFLFTFVLILHVYQGTVCTCSSILQCIVIIINHFSLFLPLILPQLP